MSRKPKTKSVKIILEMALEEVEAGGFDELDEGEFASLIAGFVENSQDDLFAGSNMFVSIKSITGKKT